MVRVVIWKTQVQFGECDPLGIAHYPNFFRWFDAASLNYFVQCGIPLWRDLEKVSGIVGTPLVETNTQFLEPAVYGDLLEVHTSIPAWERKVFIQRHVIVRDGTVLVKCTEKRVFASREPTTGRLRAILVPSHIKEKCESQPVDTWPKTVMS